MENLKKKVAVIFNTKDIENVESILSTGGLGKKIMEVLRAIEKTDFEIEKAEQQLVGFYHCKHNKDVLGLIRSMGLKKSEWVEIKKQYELEYIDEDDKQEIDEYFLETTGAQAGN